MNLLVWCRDRHTASSSQRRRSLERCCDRGDMRCYDVCSCRVLACSCSRQSAERLARDASARARAPDVLLIAREGALQRTVARILRKNKVLLELAHDFLELEKRAALAHSGGPAVVLVDLELEGCSDDEALSRVRRRFLRATVVAYGKLLSGERAARLLAAGVSSLPESVSGSALAELARELCASRFKDSSSNEDSSARAGRTQSGGLLLALDTYAALRVLSSQQRLILGLYLNGENDKQIAQTISCSESTVYEHWRRIGRKAGGSAKADAISDFHRFLGGA